MSIRKEQCNKVCRILDDVLANRPTERDSLIIAVRKAFESLELFGNSEQLPAAQPEIIRCAECKWYGRADKRRFYRGMDCLQNRIDTIVPDKDFCSRAERRE